VNLRLAALSRQLRQIFGLLPSGFPDEWQLVPRLEVDAEGWLQGSGVTPMKSHPSWHYAGLTTLDGKPDAIVAHTSATDPGTAIGMARRRTIPRKPEDRAASWHISIEADGSVVQMASCLVGTWHAAGQIKGVGSANRVSVGVELIGWEKGPWPDAQVLGAARVWRALVDAYRIPRKLAMVPHAVIDPARRSDPGKIWMSRHSEHVIEYAFAER
jgi:N-acetyl-anhydromuramyl-L-alanine amidase AmpD